MLRTITDNLPVLISYTDSNEVVRFSNLTYKTWLNRDPEQALGRRLIEVMGPELYASRRDISGTFSRATRPSFRPL